LAAVDDLGLRVQAGTAPADWSLSSRDAATLRDFLERSAPIVDTTTQTELLDPANPTELVDTLRRRVEAVKDATGEIERTWSDVLPRIDAARTTLTRLGAEAQSLGVTEPLIGRAQTLADDLAERLVADPAAVHQHDGTHLDEQVAAAARQMAKLRAGHDNLADDLAGTEETLASLRVLRAHAAAAADQTRQKILDPQGLVRVPSEQVLDGPKGLADQLDQIFDLTGAWTQRRSLLDSWLATAERLRSQLLTADEVNRGPLEQRDELRGRLRAFVAKMTGTGRSEDLELSELVQQARTLLYHSPTDLERAEATIADLAAKLQA
jgi:chromosome segregation ATPase